LNALKDKYEEEEEDNKDHLADLLAASTPVTDSRKLESADQFLKEADEIMKDEED
jgi:hypothetical protein